MDVYFIYYYFIYLFVLDTLVGVGHETYAKEGIMMYFYILFY